MDHVFIGSPCREEIELYLKNRRYSLLSNKGLRSEIVRRRTKEMEFCVATDAWDGGNRIEPRSESVRRNDPDVVRNTSSGGRRHNRRLVNRNTLKNSGYRFVRLSFKRREELVGSLEDMEYRMKHKRKVKFSERRRPRIHNTGEVCPILQRPSRPERMPRTQAKEVVHVLSLPSVSTDVPSEEVRVEYAE